VPGQLACIDPLVIEDLSPLLDLLYDPSVVKVLHACAQDLEIFAHLRGAVPGPIFDTQLAAPLLGLPEQMGYAPFVKEMRGVTLDKAQARTDWSRRPLGEAQLRYAADDVRYLVDIYPEMRSKLEALGRLDWLRAEFEPYERLERYRPDPARAWQRIRGGEKLRPKALSILQLLARWREETAQQRDLPRNWVLKDDALIDLARMAPDSAQSLGKLRSVPPKIVERYGETLLRLVREGTRREPDSVPAWKRRSRPTADEEALADVLHARLRLLADASRINSSVIASRKELLALAQGEQDLDILRGWRREMAGNELLAMCRGERTVFVEGGRVRILSTTDP
jgi:ribonuclease D